MKNEKKTIRRSSFEYYDDRSRELLKVFNEEVGKIPYELVDDVLQRVVNHPCSRFWVSEERAFRIISSMQRRPLPQRCQPLKREMYEEIYRRCESVAKAHPKWPLSRIVFHVVNQEAPKFYLTEASAHALICQERNKWKLAFMLKWRRSLSA